MPTHTFSVDVDGQTLQRSASFSVTPAPSALKVIGMSAPASSWATRLAEVGPAGVNARRIYADLTAAGNDQASLISAAITAGMMPVISYKVPLASVATLAAGGLDSWLAALKAYLVGLGTTVAVAFWHEPADDMPGADYCAGAQRFVDRVKAPTVKVGPVLNGWLLDNQVTTFETYTTPALLNAWDWFGIDTYHSGTQAAPGATIPSDRMPPLLAFLASKGKATMPVGIGEYNGYTAAALAQSGEVWLSTPTLWFACVWNNTGGKGVILSGDRLAAYKATKADPRALP